MKRTRDSGTVRAYNFRIEFSPLAATRRRSRSRAHFGVVSISSFISKGGKIHHHRSSTKPMAVCGSCYFNFFSLLDQPFTQDCFCFPVLRLVVTPYRLELLTAIYSIYLKDRLRIVGCKHKERSPK